MNALMNELHQDHQHIATLLTILKNKLTTLRTGARPNFNLMAEVVDYLTDYADDYHHGKENLIYYYMQEHYPKKSHLIEQQMHEHEELRKITQRLRADVDQALMDMPLSLEEFSRQLESFIDRQGQHLSVEETKVFPVVEQCFSIDDWEKLGESLPNREDPLFGEARELRFKNLYEALIEDLA